MKSVIFSFATHNHQPIGNFDHIIEEAFEKSYKPFFELAEKHSVRFATHFTGILLDWLEAKHPDHLQRIRGMVERGQLEVISGGFYEPILSVIPPADQQAQIRMLSTRIQEAFGFDPSGLWLAERVWEQPLASVLAEAGIHYVLLDDTHFLYAGLEESDLRGYYLTEDRGKTLAVLPIAKSLRYTIPFGAVDETIAILRDASSESGTNILCFADDGEKFGVWPGTHEHVYGEGWLEEFFRKIEENRSWIRMLQPAEILRELPARGRIYLPNASYAEMMEWALPSGPAAARYEDFLHLLDEEKTKWEQYRPFVRGGYWRNFLAKYPETNQLHKHMLRTSARLRAAQGRGTDITEAERELLSAQCNDPYWHGVFGGAYLPNLRHANYSALLRADSLLDAVEKLEGGDGGVRCESVDFDCDGAEEVILESGEFSLFVKPSAGGMIAELDFKPRNFNSTNIFSRQIEAYHQKIAKTAAESSDTAESGDEKAKSIHDLVQSKEAGLEKMLVYDRARRGSMVERFLGPESTPEALRTQKFEDYGDFVTSAFSWGWNKDAGILTLSRLGTIRTEGKSASVRLTKELKLEGQSAVCVGYRVKNESPDSLRLRFASEWAFNLLAGSAHDRYYESDGRKLDPPEMNGSGSTACTAGCNFRLVDEFLNVAIEVKPVNATEIIRYPLESVSLSESGFERIYQGSIVTPIWNFEIGPGAEWGTNLVIRFALLS